MQKKYRIILGICIALVVVFFVGHMIRGNNFEVLNPKGTIANQERQLMVIAAVLGLVVALPVFILLFTIAWKYRASNTKAKYTPDWDHNNLLEAVWWGIPCVIIIILGTITWTSTHNLDPYKPIDSSVKPVTIQVVALDWKWLFIYPQEHIATVNYVQFPENTPVNFEVTSDAPMNSFWIPQLGGQIYAMPGMSTQLHLMASGTGRYAGSSANLSGAGFAGMKFVAESTSAHDYSLWVNLVSQSPDTLTSSVYSALASPSEATPVTYYSQIQQGLYNQVIMKYMSPANTSSPSSTPDMSGMNMSDMNMQGMEMQ